MTEHIIESIKDAELVLVGIGEELDLLKKVKKDPKYIQLEEKTQSKWIMPFIRKIMLNEWYMDGEELYENLSKCLENKNYFIVSICEDGMIKKTNLNKERIVEPCGDYDKLQCSEKCNTSFHEVSEELLSQIKDYIEGKCTEEELKEPICPVCGKPLVFNNVEAQKYAEEGYLDQWLIYKKWLQGTVNKKLCVLELGVGMKYPTVIRWAFEKVAFFNQKSKFFRVHSKLYQMTQELSDKGKGICQSPEKFLKELSNGF